jgi:hypothetical protein
VKNELTISKLMMMEMPGYREQYRRIYTGSGDHVGIHQFAETINTLDDVEVTGAIAAQHVHKVLRFADQPEPSAPIPFGWDAPRYSFLLVVETKTPMGSKEITHLAGYTDRVAPIGELEFHINSTATWREMPNRDGSGYTLMSQDHLHMDPNGQALSGGNYSELMRPKDIFSRLSLGDGLAMEEVIDLRTRVSAYATRSDRYNVVPSAWLSKLVEAYLSALQDELAANESTGLWHVCQVHAEETPIRYNPVLSALAQLAAKQNGTFTFDDLKLLDSEVAEKTTVANQGSDDANAKLIYSNNYEDWDVAVGEGEVSHATIAYAAGMALPPVMNEAGLSSAHFVVLYSPDSPASVEVRIITVSPIFATSDLKAAIDLFVYEFETLVLPQLAPRDYEGIETLFLEIDADLYGTTAVRVALDKPENTKTFLLPSFADSLLSPLLTIEACNTTKDFMDLTILARELEAGLSRLTVK